MKRLAKIVLNDKNYHILLNNDGSFKGFYSGDPKEAELPEGCDFMGVQRKRLTRY